MGVGGIVTGQCAVREQLRCLPGVLLARSVLFLLVWQQHAKCAHVMCVWYHDGGGGMPAQHSRCMVPGQAAERRDTTAVYNQQRVACMTPAISGFPCAAKQETVHMTACMS